VLVYPVLFPEAPIDQTLHYEREGDEQSERTSMKGLDGQCVRCGVLLPSGHTVCRECNPADLPSPSPSQYHATVFFAVLLPLVIIAVWLIVRG
jgi:hypothetical protein